MPSQPSKKFVRTPTRSWAGDLWVRLQPLCCSGAVLRVQGSGSCSEIGTTGCADDDTPPATQPLWYFG